MKKIIQKGFTLIELLIVITIIGVLTSFVATNLQGARERARDSRRKSDLYAINQALRLYYTDAKQFPSSSTNFKITGCESISIPVDCEWGKAFNIKSPPNTYINLLPEDPLSTPGSPLTYQYYSNNSDKFLLVAQLENLSDKDIASSQLICNNLYLDFTGSKNPTKDYLVCAE